MSYDSLALRLVTCELRQALLGGTVRHIEQANAHTFSFRISRAVETHWLALSAHSLHARAHLIEKPPPGQKQSYLADFLTTHLRGGTITEIEQLGWDRILKITVQPVSDEPIQPSPKAIIAEMMGKHSNIILIDATDDRILESLKRIDETMSRHREILPGETYTLPPQQEKVDPLTLDKAAFTGIVGGQEAVRWKQLFNNIDGFSPTLAKEVVARAAETELWDAYQQVITYFDPKHVSPQLFTDGNEPIAVSALPLQQFPNATSQAFDTMSDAFCAYYDAITLKEHIASETQDADTSIKEAEGDTPSKSESITNRFGTRRKIGRLPHSR